VLSGIFGVNCGRLERLQNEEFHNLYSSPNIVRVIKSKRDVQHAWETNSYAILVRKLKGRDHSGDLSIDGRIILVFEWILGKLEGTLRIGCD